MRFYETENIVSSQIQKFFNDVGGDRGGSAKTGSAPR